MTAPRALAGLVILGVVAAAMAGATALPAAEPATEPVAAASLGWHPDVVRDELANGLRTHVLEHAVPPGEVEVRIVLHAGSGLERDGEQGLVHLLEHLAFNGSRHFPPGELFRHFESLGRPLGQHANASTGRGAVTFHFSHPSKTDEQIERVLDIVEDLAAGAMLSDEEIEAERGVVMAERRERSGVGRRIGEVLDRELLAGAPVAAHPVIGEVDVLAHAPPARLRALYERLWRPDLISVVVVGDVDAAVTSRRLRRRLVPLTNPETPRPDLPDWTPAAGRRVIVVREDISQPKAWLVMTRPSLEHDEGHVTVPEIRRSAAWKVQEDALQRALKRVARRDGSALADASVESDDAPLGLRETDGRPLVVDSVRVVGHLRRGRASEGVEELLRSVEGFLAHGPGRRDVDDLTSAFDRIPPSWGASEKELPTREVADAMEKAVRKGGMHHARADFAAVALPVLQALDAETVRREVEGVFEQARRVLVVACPADDESCPSGSAIERAWDAAIEARAEQADLGDTGPLIPNPPEPGSIARRGTIDAIGVEEATLSNGMRVLARRAGGDSARVHLFGVGRGGTAGLGRRERIAAELFAPVLALSGTADHGPEAIEHWMKVQLASGAHARQLRSGTSKAHVDGMLQRVHATFERPAFRRDIFERVRDAAVAAARRREEDASAAVRSASVHEASGGGPEHAPPSAEELASVRLEELPALHGELIGDPSEWTIVLFGDVELAALEESLERWLASIPSAERAEDRRRHRRAENGRRRRPVGDSTSRRAVTDPWVPEVPVRRRVAAVEDGKAVTTLAVRWMAENGPEARRAGHDAAAMLGRRLFASLREEMGATYGARVELAEPEGPGGTAWLWVRFESAPGRREELVAEVRAEWARLWKEAPSPEEIAFLQESYRTKWKQVESDDEPWARLIGEALARGEPLRDITAIPERVDRLSPRRFRKAVRRHLVPRATLEVWSSPLDEGSPSDS